MIVATRFIPVCSGNAARSALSLMSSPVYPRVLGERSDFAQSLMSASGLSPCARGTQHGNNPQWIIFRFIPVCSGNALRSCNLSILFAVYPRVLGERTPQPQPQSFGSGLSPCARGTPCHSLLMISRLRFIPVCSGNASIASPVKSKLPVYPRVLGERQHR